MDQLTVFTIGYQGMDSYSFLRTLREHRVEILVDVRERARSRKRGFSKGALGSLLGDAGIEYMHVPGLGSSRELREKYMEDGDFDRFKEGFSKGRESRCEPERRLAEIASRRRLCLMCYEKDPLCCHRGVVADEIASLCRARVEHLG